jgi:hypothetical protein
MAGAIQTLAILLFRRMADMGLIVLIVLFVALWLVFSA